MDYINRSQEHVYTCQWLHFLLPLCQIFRGCLLQCERPHHWLKIMSIKTSCNVFIHVLHTPMHPPPPLPTHTHIYTRMHTHVHTDTHLYTHTHTHTCMHACTNTYYMVGGGRGGGGEHTGFAASVELELLKLTLPIRATLDSENRLIIILRVWKPLSSVKCYCYLVWCC